MMGKAWGILVILLAALIAFPAYSNNALWIAKGGFVRVKSSDIEKEADRFTYLRAGTWIRQKEEWDPSDEFVLVNVVERGFDVYIKYGYWWSPSDLKDYMEDYYKKSEELAIFFAYHYDEPSRANFTINEKYPVFSTRVEISHEKNTESIKFAKVMVDLAQKFEKKFEGLRNNYPGGEIPPFLVAFEIDDYENKALLLPKFHLNKEFKPSDAPEIRQTKIKHKPCNKEEVSVATVKSKAGGGASVEWGIEVSIGRFEEKENITTEYYGKDVHVTRKFFKREDAEYVLTETMKCSTDAEEGGTMNLRFNDEILIKTLEDIKKFKKDELTRKPIISCAADYLELRTHLKPKLPARDIEFFISHIAHWTPDSYKNLKNSCDT